MFEIITDIFSYFLAFYRQNYLLGKYSLVPTDSLTPPHGETPSLVGLWSSSMVQQPHKCFKFLCLKARIIVAFSCRIPAILGVAAYPWFGIFGMPDY